MPNSKIKYYQEKQRSVIRQSLDSLNDATPITNEKALDICEFVTRKNDFWTVRNANFMRYGTQIATTKEASNGELSTDYRQLSGQSQYYAPNLIARPGEEAKFAAGLYETVVSGVAQTILKTIACLFTSFEHQLLFMKENKQFVDVNELIGIHREGGSLYDKLIQADTLACGCDSCLLHVYMKGDDLAYDVVWPSSVHVVFGSNLEDKTQLRGYVKRFVDTTDLEDASAVIVFLGGHSEKSSWQAYIGACKDWPKGRMVSYQQTTSWPPPKPGDSSILSEYERSDVGICNPMTHIASTMKGVGLGYEYPLVVIRGDARYGANECIPISDTFFCNCKEIETAWSVLLRSGIKAARGKDIISVGASSDRLPESLDVVVVPPGCTYQYIPGNSSGVTSAMDAITTLTRAVGYSRGVPPYVIIGPVPSQPESGVALAIRTAPLIDLRNTRIRLNTAQVQKIGYCEMALLTETDPSLASMFSGVRSVWTPGQYQVPTDMSTMLIDIEKARSLEVIDQVEAVRRAMGFRTSEDAIAWIEQLAERDPDYRGLDKEEPKVENVTELQGEDTQQEETQDVE